MQPSTMLRSAALLGFLAVALGAFGAHALETRLLPKDLATWETAVRYQCFHTLALGLCAAVAHLTRRAGTAARLLLLGTILFSGSLYLLVLTGWRPLAWLTPIGGVVQLLGWLCLCLPGGRSPNEPA